MTEAKPWYTSRTVWFNAIILILTVALYVLQGAMSGAISLPVSTEVLVFITGVVNLVLRFVTSQPLKVSQ